jgi:hypothetical protein
MHAKLVMPTVTTALSAMLLTVPAPAQADPCTQYGFIGDVAIRQSNGYRLEFSSTGPAATGRATATGANGATMGGNISGSIAGRNVDFTIRWDGGAGQGHYTGKIGNDDFVYGGKTVDESNPASRASWESTVPFVCLAPPAAPAPIPTPTGPPPEFTQQVPRFPG